MLSPCDVVNSGSPFLQRNLMASCLLSLTWVGCMQYAKIHDYPVCTVSKSFGHSATAKQPVCTLKKAIQV